MTKKSISYISIFLGILFTLNGFNTLQAQEQCLENLRRARTVYDEGRLHEILDVIGPDCLKGNTLTEEEKSEAYRLLILSYIYQDQPELADRAMLDLLQANPRFKKNDVTDPNEFLNLYKTFRTDPIFRWGFKFKSTYSIIDIIKTYSIASSPNSNGKYSGDAAFGGALFIEKGFFQNRITIRAEPSFTAYKMTYKGSAFAKDDSPDENTATYEDVENQSWLGLDLLARYPFLKKSKFRPNLILGPSGQLLLSSQSSNTTGIDGGESASGADLDFLATDIRKKINLSGIVGIGIVLPSRKIAFVADLTYQYGLVNITDKNNSSELSLRYGRAMSDMSLNAITLSIGLMFNKYSPKKLSN